MNKIPFAVGNAAGIAIMEVNADATLSTASGGLSVFAGLVVSRRGKPGQVLSVNADNYLAVLGDAIHPRQGAIFEPLRHVDRATQGGNGYVVRVTAPDMKIPALQLKLDSATGKITATATTFNAGATPVLPDDADAMIYIDDGDASKNRAINLYRDETSPGLFILELQTTDTAGTTSVLESHQFSFDVDARTDMGTPAFLATALENGSTRLRALVSDDAQENFALLQQDLEPLTAVPFVGGSDGDLSALTAADYLKALAVLKKSMVTFTAVLSLGCYDTSVIAALDQFAQDVRVDMFYDLHGGQTAALAITEAKSHGLGGSHQSARYYFPFSCRDKFTGNNVIFGISCEAFIAKAKGVALVSDIGGWHYSPAGTSRGVIGRQNIKPVPNLDEIDREAFVTARINTVSMNEAGDLYIDDALTTFTKNNYLRFQHVSSLTNAIARGFYQVAEAAKHEPDGVTRTVLIEGMTDLLERYVAAEALVTPRDADQGEAPFVLSLTQKESDFWELEWAVCPTGSARRIVGKPMLLR